MFPTHLSVNCLSGFLFCFSDENLEDAMAFLFFLAGSQKDSKTFPFTDLPSSYLSVSSTCRHEVRSASQGRELSGIKHSNPDLPVTQ